MFLVRNVVEMVKEMLAKAPQMAFCPDRRNNYPLHIAIRNEQECSVIFQLYNAFPEIGKIHDVETGLAPFILAATSNWSSTIDQISVIYYLLREDPPSVFELKRIRLYMQG